MITIKSLLTFCLALIFQLAISVGDILHLPILIPFTNDNPRHGVGCKVASEIALESFRNLTNSLNENYHIEPIFLDEQGTSGRALEAIIRFTFEDKFKLAPMAIGPYYTPGCKPIANSLHHFNMVQIAMSCGSPAMTNKRHKYPNFYRVRSAGDIGIFPTLKFIKEIGNWNQIAIVTTLANSYNFAIANKLFKVAENVNVTVSHFDYVEDIDQAAIDRLKKSELRVIALEVGEVTLVLRFLCLAYRTGITGPRYAFFIFLTSFSHPNGLPATTVDGCSREEIIEQYRYCHFIGPQLVPISTVSLSKSGLTLDQFEQLYKIKLNNRITADSVKRFQCYDAVSKALFSLNNAEERLMGMNKTLADFLYEPNFVMKIVNASAATTEIFSLRTGSSLEYSSRLELDMDPQLISHWREDVGNLVAAYSCKMENSKGNPMNILEYKLTKVNDFNWYTSDGQPPAQMASTEMVILHIGKPISLTIIVIASISSIIALILAGIALFNKKLPSGVVSPVFISVFLMNMAAIAFIWPYPFLLLCFLQPSLCVCGLSICNFILAISAKRDDKPIKKSLIFFTCFVPVLLLLLWLVIDSISLKEFNSKNDHYDEMKDVKYIYTSFTCFTMKFGYTNWALLTAGYQMLIWIYFLQTFHWKMKEMKKLSLTYWHLPPPPLTRVVVQRVKISLNSCRILIVNKLALMVSAILIVSTLHGLEASLITIAITILLMSWITSICLMISPFFNKKPNP